MDKIVVVPLSEVENIRFGASREIVRRKFGKYTEYKKSPLSINTSDDFGFCHVLYDKENTCEAFEFFPSTKVEINGNIIFPGKIDAVFKRFGQFYLVEDTYINFDKSIGIISSSGTMECILFGKKDYYKWLKG